MTDISASPANDFLSEWKTAIRTAGADGPLREAILRSWSRSRAAGLDASSGVLPLKRVPPRELLARQREAGRLVEAAIPHLRWISTALGNILHVAYLVDRDGIVLASEGNDEEAKGQYGLTPGYDWSEAAMGTNGAGTALARAAPVVVFGADHFLRPLKGFVCAGAPIRDPGGRVAGAIDVSTRVEDGRPTNLLLAAQAAFAVELSLERRVESPAERPRGSQARRS